MMESDLIVLLLMAASALVGGVSVWVAVALGRTRPSSGQQVSLPSLALVGQLNRVEVALESVAVEVERIGEAERFVAKLLAAEARKSNAQHPRTEPEAPDDDVALIGQLSD